MREVAAIKQNKQIFSIILILIFAFWLMAFSLLSLAVFVICAKILIKTGFCEKLARTPVARLCPLLGMSCGGLVAFLVGLVSGFPMGAVALSELVLRGDITKEEEESLMLFSEKSEHFHDAAKEKLSAARVVSSSVSEGAAALLSVCGFVVFFCVL